MAKKELTREDFKEVESVLPTPADKEAIYVLYSSLINEEDNSREVEERTLGRVQIIFWEALKTGKYSSRTEAFQYVREYIKENGIYCKLADSPEEAVNFLQEVVLSRVRNFIENREEALRSTFCKVYLAPLMLAGMRSGILLNTWWRAACYGFSVEPYTYDKKKDTITYNAFPYRSLEEMKEEDKRAFLWTVEDFFYSNFGRYLFIIFQQEPEITEDGEEKRYFTPYPEEGYGKEEIARMHSDKEVTVTVDELYESWEYEGELYFPVILNRIDEAVYYALKYKGTEYLDYIKSLNVEEDYGFQTGAEGEDIRYTTIMKEGYIWHSDK